MQYRGSTPEARLAAIHGLAIVGFIVLVAAVIWLAVYSTNNVPNVVGSIGAAAVSLSQILSLAPESSLEVVPTVLTTISFGDENPPSTPATTTIPKATKPVVWTPGTPIVVGGDAAATTSPTSYYGLPDLAVVIVSIGYLANATNESFVATTTIPANTQIAMKFRVTNVGTNVSGTWTMTIAVPSNGASLTQSFTQESLYPSQPSEYIARIGNITPGAGRTIIITIDPNNQLVETNKVNNAISTTVTVLGN